jgi:hypothetical protein
MLRALIFAAAVTLAGCASAVYDSLERRGIDAKTVLADHVRDARNDAATAAGAIEAAAAALSAVRGLEGPALARQIGAADAGAQDAAIAAQGLRLSADTVGASGARYFREQEEKISLYPTAAEQEGAAATLKTQAAQHKKIATALKAAGLRLSPALSLITGEIGVLRKDATSGVVVRSRAVRIEAAGAAAAEAGRALRDAGNEADRYLAALAAGG